MDIDEEASRWPDTFEPERWDPQRRRRRRFTAWLCAGLAMAVLVIVGGPAIYFRIEGTGPKRLTLPAVPARRWAR